MRYSFELSGGSTGALFGNLLGVNYTYYHDEYNDHHGNDLDNDEDGNDSDDDELSVLCSCGTNQTNAI